jgi:uncharacterized protein
MSLSSARDACGRGRKRTEGAVVADIGVGEGIGRRRFLRGVALATGSAILGGTALRSVLAGAAAIPGPGPYGPLGAADANGIQLPAGFTSRLLATTGQPVVGSNHIWHAAPDGGACFPTPTGGWVYVSNSEVSSRGGGGAAALRFDATGALVGAHPILTGTTRNCAGGRTVANTWLSCEENGAGGKVYECDPLVAGQGVQRPALGSFNHEAAVEDPGTRAVYLTEDDPNGRLYRFVPTVAGNFTAGQLFAARVADGRLTWVATSAAGPDRQTSTTAFNGGEGMWIEGRTMYFTTKGDQRVWEVQLDTQTISVLYDGNATPTAALGGVDNCTVHSPSGDVFVCEDGGNMEVCLITAGARPADRVVAAFLRVVGHDTSELTGAAFSPDHTRLYVSSQRGGADGLGRTYEIRGPFRTAAVPPTVVTDTLVAAGSVWRYHDQGTDLGTAWRAPAYNDTTWKQGAGPLGYGDPVRTVIEGGALPAKPMTSYFRTTFTATAAHTNLTVRLRRDDGAVIHLNGVEVARSNMPAGTVTFATAALSSVNDAAETTINVIPIAATLLNGANVLAVEVHQFQASSSDLGFDLSLTGTRTVSPTPTTTTTVAPTTTSSTTSTTSTTAPPSATQTLVPLRSTWRYHDLGQNLGTTWRGTGYDDRGWKSGAGPLGYGDPVTTLLRAGTTETRANTCYFRTWFTGSTAHTNLTLLVRRDDGAVIYLNGVEVARTNMPTGAIAFGTRALSSVNDAAETTLYTIPISARLVEGRNLLAVEVHQFQQASSDLTFDLSLTGTR